MPCNKEGPTQLCLKAGAYFRNVMLLGLYPTQKSNFLKQVCKVYSNPRLQALLE